MFDTPWERRVDDWMVAERLEPEHRAQQQQRRPLTRPGGAGRRVLNRVSISPKPPLVENASGVLIAEVVRGST
jgi:hypothetical protein